MKYLTVAIAALTISLASNVSAATQLIDFEGLTAGSVVGTIGIAAFSGNNNIIVYDFGGTFANSGVNTIAEQDANFNGDLFVDFAVAVTNFSFFSSGDDATGVQAQINVFVNGAFAALIDLIGDGNAFGTDIHDLSSFANITRIEIFNVTDPAGLVYDDFKFDYGNPAPVPLPASALLLTGALAGLGAMKRRKAV